MKYLKTIKIATLLIMITYSLQSMDTQELEKVFHHKKQELLRAQSKQEKQRIYKELVNIQAKALTLEKQKVRELNESIKRIQDIHRSIEQLKENNMPESYRDEKERLVQYYFDNTSGEFLRTYTEDNSTMYMPN